MKRFLVFSLAALAVAFGSTAANAQWGHGGHHDSHHGGHHAAHHGGYFGHGEVSIRRSFSPPSFGHSFVEPRYHAPRAVWHDTTHLDYHRPSITFHRGHIHFTPGHYDLHRTGHYDHLPHY
ncbi:MAG: hypothetical protein KDA45_10235 [Planctomycetales bacterium]|nr:hypothetical protein [Planctomycetales bacterium]